MLIMAISPFLAVLGLAAGIWAFETVTPKLKNTADKLLKGNLSDYKDCLNIILVHLQEKPEDWLFRSDSARFPKDGGMAKISIDIEKRSKVKIMTSALNEGKYTDVDGYYAGEFIKIIEESHKQLVFQSSVRMLFPEKEHLLLENKKLI